MDFLKRCLLCSHWDVKATPSEMRRHGLAVCGIGKRWEYLSPRSSCPKFKPVDEEMASKRLEWANKRGM